MVTPFLHLLATPSIRSEFLSIRVTEFALLVKIFAHQRIWPTVSQEDRKTRRSQWILLVLLSSLLPVFLSYLAIQQGQEDTISQRRVLTALLADGFGEIFGTGLFAGDLDFGVGADDQALLKLDERRGRIDDASQG